MDSGGEAYNTLKGYKDVNSDKYSETKGVALGQMCARLWTEPLGSHSMYSLIRDIIVKDDADGLEEFFLYIKCLIDFMGDGDSDFKDEKTLVYRGSHMSEAQQAQYKVGDVVNIASPFSSTTDEKVAKAGVLGSRDSPAIIGLNIPKGYTGARHIEKIRCASIFIQKFLTIN